MKKLHQGQGPGLRYRGRGQLPNKGRQGCAWALGILGVNFLPRHQVLGDKFCLGIRLSAIFDKKCVIFEKSEQKAAYILKDSDFCSLKFMKTCPGRD